MSDDENQALLSESEPPEPVKAVRADALERADQAWRLRVVGASWREVAEVVGFANDKNAMRAVREIFGELPEPDRSELRAIWRERLELLFRQAYRDVLDRQPGAVAAAVKVAETAVRLDGLSAPTEVNISTPTDRELEQWVVAVVAQDNPALQVEEADVLGIDAPDDDEEPDL